MSGDTPPAVLRPSADKSDKLQGLERPQKNRSTAYGWNLGCFKPLLLRLLFTWGQTDDSAEQMARPRGSRDDDQRRYPGERA
jgi:hypothetical protein